MPVWLHVAIYSLYLYTDDSPISSNNSAAVLGIAAVMVVLVLLLLLSVTVNIVLFVQRAKSQRYKYITANQYNHAGAYEPPYGGS